MNTKQKTARTAIEHKIKAMADIYREKRDDVATMLDSILEGNEPNPDNAESRFVYFSHNGSDYEYDTLTTLPAVKVGKYYETIRYVEYID